MCPQHWQGKGETAASLFGIIFRAVLKIKCEYQNVRADSKSLPAPSPARNLRVWLWARAQRGASWLSLRSSLILQPLPSSSPRQKIIFPCQSHISAPSEYSSSGCVQITNTLSSKVPKLLRCSDSRAVKSDGRFWEAPANGCSVKLKRINTTLS